MNLQSEYSRIVNINDYRDEDLPLFASDVNDKGAKVFYTCGYETFINEYYHRLPVQQRHEYEVLRWSRPTKLFFDLDADAQVMSNEVFKDQRLRLIEFVHQLCMELFSSKCDEVYILESSTETKHSNHIIFDFVMANMECVKGMANMVAASFQDIVDMSVYTRNRCFRIAGSSKYGKKIPLTISANVGIFQTLIQGVLPEEYHGALDYQGRPFFSYAFTLTMEDVSSKTSIRAPEKLVEYIKQVFKAQLRPNGKEDGQTMTFLVHGMYCPSAKKVHKSNNMFFNIRKETMNGWFVCSDVNCPKIHIWSHMNYLFCFV